MFENIGFDPVAAETARLRRLGTPESLIQQRVAQMQAGRVASGGALEALGASQPTYGGAALDAAPPQQGFMPNEGPFKHPEGVAPQQERPGFFEALGGLPGNPMFNMGMGLLAAGYDRRINPWGAASQGLNNAAVFKYNQEEAKYRSETRKAEAERRDEIRKAGERLLKTVQNADADGVRTGAEDQEIKREALQYQILKGDDSFTEMLFQPKKIPGSPFGKIIADVEDEFLSPQQGVEAWRHATHIGGDTSDKPLTEVAKLFADLQNGRINRQQFNDAYAKLMAMPAAERERFTDIKDVPGGGLEGIWSGNAAAGFVPIPGSENLGAEATTYQSIYRVTDPTDPNYNRLKGLNPATNQYEVIGGSSGVVAPSEASVPKEIALYEFFDENLRGKTPEERQRFLETWNAANPTNNFTYEEHPDGLHRVDKATGTRELVMPASEIAYQNSTKATIESGNETVAEFRENYQDARAELDEMQGLVAELLQLNAEERTGAWTPPGGWYNRKQPTVQKMNAKLTQIGLQRIKEFGLAPTSDVDVENAISLAGSIDNWGETNDVLLMDFAKSLERTSIALDATLDWYDQAQTNLPNLPGMSKALNQYVDSQISDAGVQPSRLVFPKSQAEYDALPPGTPYVENGELKVKR